MRKNLVMQIFWKPFQWLYCVYAMTLFVLLMLIIFPFALLTTLFGHIKGGNMAYRVCMFWGDVWFFMIGIRHKNIFPGGKPGDKQFVYVANHISYLDAAIIVKAIRKPVRPLGKAEMAKIPVFGFIYRNVIVTVDRSNALNRAKSVRRLKAVLRKGISIFFFPEGTFNMTGQPLKNFYDGAFRIAIETNTPIKPVLFIDSYRRMHYRHIFTLNPGINRVIHLPEIEVTGYSLSELDKLKEHVYGIMEDELRNWNVHWVK